MQGDHKIRIRILETGARAMAHHAHHQPELEVDEPPDEVLLCEDCHDRVNAADIHWFVSHVDPTFISGSSDEAVLKPSAPPLGLSTVAGGAATAAADGEHVDAVARRERDGGDGVLT